jgi:peptidoglycan/xylan/chitin deacetylase (PgdA/CDA1 family)
VSFTFDDFPSSAVSNGGRLLETYGVHGTFYVTGSYCGRVINNVPQFHAEDLRYLANAGHEIGCHTFSHLRVSTLSVAALKREISLNAGFLARYLPGVRVETFAYPFGDFSFKATMQLQSIFVACRSSQSGLNTGRIDLGRLRSIRLYDHVIDPEGLTAVVKQAVKECAWLIFHTHDVSSAPTNFGCRPSLLERAVKAAISAGVEIRPVSAAVKAIVSAAGAAG